MSVERKFRSTQQSIKEVELAHEFETFKQLPKFNHVRMAVINPSPQKVKKPSPPPKPDFEMRASNAKLNVRRYQAKQIPEHLMRAPQDSNNYASSPRKSQSSMSPSKTKSLKELKQAKQHGQKELSEKNRVKKAESHMKQLFETVKRHLDRNDDEYILPDSKAKVVNARNEVKSKRLFRYLYEQYSGRLTPSVLLLKQDFLTFIKTVFKQADNDLTDIFYFFCKKLPGMSNNTSLNDSNSGFSGSLKQVKPKSAKSNTRMTDPKKKDQLLTQKSDVELRDLKLDLAIVDHMFDKWQKEEESLSGTLNMKVIKQKNLDFRLKLDSWKKFADERKRLQKRAFEHNRKLRETFDKLKNDFNIEKDKVIECILNFDKLCDERSRYMKEEKIVNNFLSQLPENSQILEIKDIERILDNITKSNKQELTLFNDFITIVKTQCVLNHYFFSFYDIPDLIVKRKYVRKDYELLIKLLTRVKKIYLLEKAKLIPEKPITEIEITDEDLVPLELFDQALSQIQHKMEDSKSYIVALIQEAKIEASKKISLLNVDSEKTKKIVENSVFINYLNSRLEQTHATIFSYNFKNQLLYYYFCAGQAMFRAAREFEAAYLECVKADKVGAKQFQDFKERLSKEMLKFNGKSQGVGEGVESISETTNQEKKLQLVNRAGAAQKQGELVIKPQEVQRQQQQQHKYQSNMNIRDEEIDDAIATLNQGMHQMRDRSGSNDSLNFRDSAFDPMQKSNKKQKRDFEDLIPSQDPMRKLGQGLGQIPKSQREQYMEEEEEEMQRRREEEERKKKESESPYKEMYKDTQGNPYDPTKKFGIILPDSLIYENVTSSYPLNLPTDYYHKYIQQTVPGKDNGKWFIRPHHLETLTEHPLSVKDDVLNTRYYSHYNQQYGKKEEVNEKEVAINMIERHLEQLKQTNYMMMASKGQGAQFLDRLDQMREQLQSQAQQEFDRLIHDKSRGDAKELIIEAYEAVLTEKRKLEKEVLNSKRQKEYEKNRPPQDRWYELKNTEFSKELYRNRMALKPNDENRVYLQTLQDPNLY